MPVILATQEAEIRRMEVQSQPRQIVPRDPISKNPSCTHTHKNRTGGVAQGEGPEFKPQYCKNQSINKRILKYSCRNFMSFFCGGRLGFGLRASCLQNRYSSV
jgi:hypothetical protein